MKVTIGINAFPAIRQPRQSVAAVQKLFNI